ncbi:hypothetical protein CVT26_015636 [Gymnopilus dilepis]|uniref:L-tyrosine decarboxylase C-terminal domain-containing protein n=1 Tax=Gymnopilus dilepis TaxID=231916 RepID=A0A409YDG6_9AGAR|nr:hypothetical protein CVT26_015636 [Gymnopilus dilepis]
MLPSEERGLHQSEIDKETQYIIDNIVNKTNSEMLEDQDIMKKISELGGDLIITVFACNFHIDGTPNKDVTEANFLNRRMFERFSVTKCEDDPYTRELIVGSTTLEQETYGVALDKFKERLGLEGDGDLTVLTLVPMSPFPTAHNLVKSFADTFKQAALDEIKECYRRIIPTPSRHSFVMQGTDHLFLSYIADFSIGNYRQQVVLRGKLPETLMNEYAKEVESNPAALFTLTTEEKGLLSQIIADRRCKVTIWKKMKRVDSKDLELTSLIVRFRDQPQSEILARDVYLSNIEVISDRSIAPGHLDKEYPAFMPFYLYGSDSQQHISHMLVRAPNVQLRASRIVLDIDKPISSLATGGFLRRLIVIADNIYENAMQPFNADHKPSFFAPGRILNVSLYEDPNAADTPGPGLLENLGPAVAKGTLALSAGLHIDYKVIDQERGPALSLDNPNAQSDGIRDIAHYLGMPSVGENYSMSPLDLEVIDNELVDPYPADAYGRMISIRKGWRDLFDAELAKRNLEMV